MQVTVRVEPEPAGGGWQVRVLGGDGTPLMDPATGQPVLAEPRPIRRATAEDLPLPPETEVNALPAGDVQTLCADPTGTAVYDVYLNIVGRQTRPGDVERFGRYLFATLLGDSLWTRIVTAAGAQAVELALDWDNDSVLNRLPWEMMRGPRGFLAAEPRLAITRRVPGPGRLGGPVASPPRVLFVVGTGLDEEVIRPGAEYLGLLRSLTQRDLFLRTHLLLEASTKTLAQAVSWFQPTVVHFICHGWFDSNRRGYLELRDPEDEHKAAQVYAPSLVACLRGEANLSLPPIVVLNACHTAITGLQTVGQAGLPLAAELVGEGVPLVVGMAGRVADQACRLFTRRFYEALLEDGDVAAAAAEGRRAGIRHGTDPLTTIDWAMPTLFLSREAGEAHLRIQVEEADQAWQGGADEYATPSFPAFCDRTEALRWYDLLLADERTQKADPLWKKEVQVLLVSLEAPETGRESQSSTNAPRFGRTRLLRQMATKAIFDGHLPILVSRDDLGGKTIGWPKTLRDLLRTIRRASNLTAQRLGLAAPTWRHIDALASLQPGEPLPAWFPSEIKGNYNDMPDEPLVVAQAFRTDLLEFLQTARAARPDAERARTRLLLLVDDVELMGEAVTLLLDHLLGPFGLLHARTDVRVVLTYAVTADQQTAAKTIEDWRGQWTWQAEVSISCFQPSEERMAYEHFLLHWRDAKDRPMPLAFAPVGETWINWLLTKMRNKIRGIPSNLRSEAGAVIEMGLDEDMPIQVLCRANDEDALRNVRSGGGG